MKKDNNQRIFAKNLFRNKRLLICLLYGCTGVNFIVSSLFSWNPDNAYPKLSLMLGVIMLSMVPISLFDNREEMRGTFNVIITSIIHFVFILCLSWIHSTWCFLILYVCELLCIILICVIELKRSDKKTQK